MPNPLSTIFRFILKLVLGLFAALIALSLLAATLMVVAFSLLKSLLTGRKPAPAMVFGRFQQFSAQGMRPGGSPRDNAPSADASNVVDVEVREIREEKRLS